MQVKNRIFIMAAVLLAAAIPLRAQVQARDGVRAAGLGGAFLAISDDESALQFSPAGALNSPKRWQIGFSHHRLFTELGSNAITLNQIAFIYNREQPALTSILRPILEVTFHAPAKPRPDTVRTNGIAHDGQRPLVLPDYRRNKWAIGAGYYGVRLPGQTQHTVLLSAAYGFSLKRKTADQSRPRDLDPIPSIDSKLLVPNQLAIGVTGRYVYFAHDTDFLLDPDEVNSPQELEAIRNFLQTHDISVGSFALDASVNLYFSHRFQLAAGVLNLVQPNLAASPNDGASRDPSGRFARRYRVAAAYRPLPNLLTALDIEKNRDADGLIEDYTLFFGAEYHWRNDALPIRLRGGLNHNWLAAGFGIDLSRLYANLYLNGVYQYSLHGGEFGNFRFGLNYGK